jgi:DNA invertase Pin-like site-specific DNA recombinase
MPTRTIAYLRVSTDKQADRGVSLGAQRAKVHAYAELYDLELLEVIGDAGESAKSLDRPGLMRALGMLKAGEAEALLGVKLDRLTRRGAPGPQRPRLREPVGAEAIAERTAIAMQHKAKQGEYTGG